MQRGKITKLSIYPDYAVSEASTLKGANINCVAFNLDFIAARDRNLAVQLVGLLNKCKELQHGKNSY